MYEELIRWVQGESIKSYFLRGDESINNKSVLDGEDFNPEDAELANNAEKYVKKEIDRLKSVNEDTRAGEVNHNLKSYCEGYVKLFEKKKEEKKDDDWESLCKTLKNKTLSVIRKHVRG